MNYAVLGAVNMERLDHKLDCKNCGTVYLNIPDDVNGTTVINCSTCGQFLGYWASCRETLIAKVVSMEFLN